MGNASPLPKSQLASILSAVLAWPGCVRGKGPEARAGHWRQNCLQVSMCRESSRSRSLGKSRVQQEALLWDFPCSVCDTCH